MIIKEILKKYGPFFIAILFIVLIFIISRNQLEEFKKIKNIGLLSILWISMLFVASQLLNGYMLKIFMNLFEIRLSFAEWFGLINVQSFGNYLPLSGGLISNMVYLKAKKKLPVSKYVSYLAGDTVVKLLVFGIIGMVMLLVLSVFNSLIFITLLSFILFALVCILFPQSKIKSNNRFINWIFQIHKGWDSIKTNRKVVIKCVLIHISILIIISLQFYIIFNELGYDVAITHIFILTIMTNVIRLASIFPGNLGLREAIAGSVINLFGFPFSLGLVAAIIGRGISMFWIFLFGIIFSFILTGEKKILVEEPK